MHAFEESFETLGHNSIINMAPLVVWAYVCACVAQGIMENGVNMLMS